MEEKYPEALMSAESFSKKWEREKKALAVFSNHGPIDDITLNIGELFAGIKTKSPVFAVKLAPPPSTKISPFSIT